MARDPLGATVHFRRNTAEGWTLANPILGAAEPGYERDTKKLKVGDGVTPWNQLDYFVTDEHVRDLISEIITGGDYDGGILQALTDHINSLQPHPVYDDGPSFVLLYENAKV